MPLHGGAVIRGNIDTEYYILSKSILMSKHDKSIVAEPVDPDLLRRTEAAILDYMEKHEGKMPTQAQVNETVKTSFTRLGPAIRTVNARLVATQTKLANMPEIPDDLRQAHEQLLKDLWARTRELQNGEIVELRQVQAEKDRASKQAILELEEVIGIIEAALICETKRADAAEADCFELRRRLEEVTAEVTQANARLAERDFIMGMFTPKPTELADVDKTRKPTHRGREDSEFETGDLFGPKSDHDSEDDSRE